MTNRGAAHKLKVGDRVAREAPIPRRGTVRAIFDDDPDVVEVRWDSEGLPLAITRESASSLTRLSG